MRSQIDRQQVADALELLGRCLPSDPDFNPPRIADRYETLSILGCDGQATVVLAHDEALRRNVVLKIYQDTRNSKSQQKRIINEGRALAHIDSPHVVGCLGVEQWQGVSFLVLEHVQGAALDEYLDTVAVNRHRLLQLFRQIVLGVDAAHRCGLVHHDLKPSNVLVDQSGCAKLIDFGLVASSKAEPARNDSPGTPAFMSPEIARHKGSSGVRSDIFGLGAILYFILTGNAPFAAETTHESRQRARTGTIKPPIQLDPGIPVELNTICMKCLATEPAERFADTRELLKAIDPIVNRRTRRRKKVAAVATVGLLGAIGAATWLFIANPPTLKSNQSVLSAEHNKTASLPYQANWEQLGMARQQVLEQLAAGNWQQAQLHQRRAVELAGKPALADALLKEEQLKLDFLNSFPAKSSSAKKAQFQSVMAELARLELRFSEDRLHEAAALLAPDQLHQNLQDLQESVGMDNLFALTYRQRVAAINNELVEHGATNHHIKLKELLDLVVRYNTVLGANSYAALFAREEVAYHYQSNFDQANALRAFEMIYEQSQDTMDIRRRFAAFALMERARMVAWDNPALARQYFQQFREFQASLNDADRSLTCYYAMDLNYNFGEYLHAEEFANQLLLLIPDDTTAPEEQVRRTSAHAVLSRLKAIQARDATSEKQCQQLTQRANDHARQCQLLLDQKLAENTGLQLVCTRLLTQAMIETKQWDRDASTSISSGSFRHL